MTKPKAKKSANKKKKNSRKAFHLFVISILSLSVVYQLIMSRAQLVDLHYQIETIEYEISKIKTEKNAYYQHQAELTKLSRLKESISADNALLKGDRIYRLGK